MRSRLLLFLFVLSIFSPMVFVEGQSLVCHYTCATCYSSDYYGCLTCPVNRGLETQSSVPFAGMCYCIQSTDQNELGQCTTQTNFNQNNKALIAAFIALSMVLSFLMLLIRGFRYYFIKIIEDIQEISLIVFINLYFPQQFDIFMTQLYRFNISSFMFESMANGSLFKFDQSYGVVSTDGTNVFGKYKLLYKSANFFSNMFTWIIVFLGIIVFLVILRFLNKKYNSQESQIQQIDQESKHQKLMNMSQASLNNQSLILNQPNMQDTIQVQRRQFKVTKVRKDPTQLTFPNILNRLYNMMTFNFMIAFFSLSLIEINVNVFTQISNLTFSSSFAATGAFFSAVFVALELVLLILLFIKTQQEVTKPTWMQDHSYSATHYLIRTNYKSLTKYFFFSNSIKKILLALLIVVFYDSSSNAILSFSVVQCIFLCFSIYCEPFEKRYIRIHFYICETLKLFFFVSLINFVQKYKQFTKLIEITKVLFQILAGIFGFHFTTILINLIIQWKIYWHETKQICSKIKAKCCCQKSKDNNDEMKQNQYKQSQQGQQKQNVEEPFVIGYFHFVWEKQDRNTQPETPHESVQLNDKDDKASSLKNNDKFDKQINRKGSINSESGLTKNSNKMKQAKEKEQQQEKKEQQEKDEYKQYFYVYNEYHKNLTTDQSDKKTTKFS